MTEDQKSALTTWLQAGVAVAALFVPGLDDAARLVIIAFGAATLTVLQKFLPKQDAEVVHDAAVQRLAREKGIVVPTVKEEFSRLSRLDDRDRMTYRPPITKTAGARAALDRVDRLDAATPPDRAPRPDRTRRPPRGDA